MAERSLEIETRDNLRREVEILEELLKIAKRFERHVFHPHDATGGVIHRIPNDGESQMETRDASSLPPLGPGVTAKFQVTPTETDGVVDENTLAAQTAWTSSDPANFPPVLDPTDPTGDTVDVTIPESEDVTEEVTLTWTYTNADTTTATASATFNIVTGVVTPVDVTGGTINRIA